MGKGISLGGWAFIIGLILAIVIAIIGSGDVAPWAFFVLAILGLIVGLLNVTDKEVVPFLIAGVAFLISFTALGNVITTLAFGWEAVASFFTLLGVFMAPAVAIVSLQVLFGITKN